MSETSREKIMRVTGRKPSFCSCSDCAQQCRTPCLGTPEDIQKIIEAGYVDRLKITDWKAGVLLRQFAHPVLMVQAAYDPKKKACTFFNNGLCELHDKGLKPTEGVLSHHTLYRDNWDPRISITFNVAKEWLAPYNIDRIVQIIKSLNSTSIPVSTL